MPIANRSMRLELRATPQQKAMFCRAAEVSQKSVTEFVFDSAYRAAERTLLERRVFVVTGGQSHTLLDLFERPEK